MRISSFLAGAALAVALAFPVARVRADDSPQELIAQAASAPDVALIVVVPAGYDLVDGFYIYTYDSGGKMLSVGHLPVILPTQFPPVDKPPKLENSLPTI